MKRIHFPQTWRSAAVRQLSVSLALILCLGLLAGCGGNPNETSGSDPQTSQEIHTDIKKETQTLAFPSETDQNWQLLSMQFHGEDVVQFWGKKNMDGNAMVSLDVYLFEGEGDGRLLMEEASRQYYTTWFLDKDNNYYVMNDGIFRLDREGKTVWHWKDGRVRDICQLFDGRIMLLVNIKDKLKLAELDPGTGEVSVKDSIEIEEDGNYIGAGESGLLLLNKEGFWEVDADNGSKICVMPFEGSSYSFGEVVDFRQTGDGKIETIKGREVESLQLADVRENRTKVTVRNDSFSAWQKYWTEEFNRRNKSYYVVLESCSPFPSQSEQRDYRTRTGVEIATGKGPDIIGGDVLNDVYSLIEKGVLEDLAPYMAASGIREEDYFRAAFDCWRDGEKIYAVEPQVRLSGAGLWMSEDLLGDCEEVDIETLVDALYNYPEEKVVVKAYWTPDLLMDYLFYVGTEDLWGTVDWEKGTCDFGGELFARMLEVAKRYGYSEQKENYPVLAGGRKDFNCYDRESIAQLKAEGKRFVGYLTDDGCHNLLHSTEALAINSNSPNKEGAWEYLSFLLGQEAQSDFSYPSASPGYDPSGYAMLRSAFAEVMANELEEGAIGTIVMKTGVVNPYYKAGQQEFKDLKGDEEAYRKLYDIDEETVKEIESIIEDARHRPLRTEPIREIIYEEAADYFNGSKSIEEVVKVIQNRVQLYLNEHR